MTKLTVLLASIFLITGCSRGKISYYETGNLKSRVFQEHIGPGEKIRGEHYQVKRNKQGQIISVKHLGKQHELVEKSAYNYSRKNELTRSQLIEYFFKGPPRISRRWSYENNRVIEQEEKWFTRSRLLEKRLTIYYDSEQKPYLEETWGLGNKIANSTEYYYDFKHRLDKSRRNFFQADGSLRDYWLTVYNDQIQITTEEHYLPDNSLIAFYRYAYHPNQDYRESEEILDENRDVFISRKYNEYGYLTLEEEMSRSLVLKKRLVYEYNEKGRPLWVHHYNSAGKLIKTSKYKKLRKLGEFQTTL